MESLAERIERLDRERAAAIVELNAAKIRETESKKQEQITRLLADLENEHDMTMCGTFLRTVPQVKHAFSGPSCHPSCCRFATCQQIVSMTGKASPVKRQGKANGEKHKLAEIKMNTKREKGKITYSQEGRVEHSFTVKDGENWKSFTDRIKTGLQELNYILSTGQIQGIGHKGAGNKYEKLVMGK